MLLVVMVASVLAVVFGLEKSASVIFEADALYPSSAKMNVEAVQHIKRQKVMPKLWAPMLESFIGEAILFLVLFSGSVAGDGWNILVWIIGFNLLVIIFLGQYFYKAGRPGDAFDEIR
jgi:hypothetical protein